MTQKELQTLEALLSKLKEEANLDDAALFPILIAMAGEDEYREKPLYELNKKWKKSGLMDNNR